MRDKNMADGSLKTPGKSIERKSNGLEKGGKILQT